MKQKANSGYMIFLSVVAAIGGILFGYDTAVISGTTTSVTTQFGLTVMQQGWYVGCALIGSILGVMIAGVLSDNLGRKKTMFIASVLFSISAIGCALCVGFTDLVIYRIIGGFGIGIVSIVCPMYISEIAIAQKRGALVSLIPTCNNCRFPCRISHQLPDNDQCRPDCHNSSYRQDIPY
jgi:SP family arabinose:H+ symporter-like MFS transporter